MVHLEYGVEEQLYGYPGPQNDKQEQIKPETLLKANIKTTEAVLLWGHHGKVRFFEKDNSAGKNRRQQQKKKSKYEMDWLHKRSHGHQSMGAEQGC